jgi:hypothetical protein
MPASGPSRLRAHPRQTVRGLGLRVRPLRNPVERREFAHGPMLAQRIARLCTVLRVPFRPGRQMFAGRKRPRFFAIAPAIRQHEVVPPDPTGIGPKRHSDLHALSPQRPRDCTRSIGRTEGRAAPAEPTPDCSARCSRQLQGPGALESLPCSMLKTASASSKANLHDAVNRPSLAAVGC